LALAEIVSLLRSPSFRYAAGVAVVATSAVLPLVNALVEWCGGTAIPMAVLLAIEPAGLVLLLVLSLAHHVKR
jgi:hypothetical protein